MSWIALYKNRWYIIAGILLIIIISLSIAIYFKNQKIDEQLEQIGKIKTELNISYEKLKETNSHFDSCKKALLNSKDLEESKKRMIDAITQMQKAKQFGSSWSPELERCIRQREEDRKIIEQLKKENNCPSDDNEVLQDIWKEMRITGEIIQSEQNK